MFSRLNDGASSCPYPISCQAAAFLGSRQFWRVNMVLNSHERNSLEARIQSLNAQLASLESQRLTARVTAKRFAIQREMCAIFKILESAANDDAETTPAHRPGK